MLTTHPVITSSGGGDVRRKQALDQLSSPAGHDPGSLEQARAVVTLLPRLMRQMSLFDDSPVNELPLTQLRVCALLYEQPRSMSALSRELGITLSAMTQLADRLERVELVQRVAEDSDRRVRQLRLTARGAEMMQNHREERIACVLAVFQHLSPASRQEIVDALKTLLSACEASRDASGSTSPVREP